MATSDYKIVDTERYTTVQLPAVTSATTYPQSRSSLFAFRLLLAGAGLLIGLLLAVQWRSASTHNQPASRESTRQQVSASIQQFESEQTTLKQQVGGLRAQLTNLQQQSAVNQDSLGNAKQVLQDQQIAAGLVPLRGPGVVISFDDSQVQNIPEGEDLARYIIHEYDLRDGINTLLGAGAEAISLNGERLVGSSSVYCVGSTIIVNSTRLSPPYVITAIGDRAKLADAMQTAPQMSKFLQRKILYDVQMQVDSRAEVYVPEYKNAPAFKYATPTDAKGRLA